MGLKIRDVKRIEIEKYSYIAEISEHDIVIFIDHNMTTTEEATIKRVMENENYNYYGILSHYNDNDAGFLFSKKL